MRVEAAGRATGRLEGTRRFSPRRVATAAALIAWAFLFWFLLISGRSTLYLSPRTDWVIPVGAVILTGASLGSILSLRDDRPAPLGDREAWALGLIVLPVVVVLALPPAALGSYAASRRSSFTSSGFTASAEDIRGGDLSLIDLAGATQSEESHRALVERAGSQVAFVGFVTRDKSMAADEFRLTRFIISCCVADALSVQVRVVGAPPGKFQADDWVRVEGTMYPLPDEVVLQVSQVTAVDRPKHPYLSP